MNRQLPQPDGFQPLKPIRLSHEQVRMEGSARVIGEEVRRKEADDALNIISRERMVALEAEAERKAAALEAQMQAHLAQAEAEAADIVRQATEQYDAAMNAAREEGYNAGYADGMAQVADDTARLMTGAQLIMQGACEARDQVLNGFHKNAAELVKYVAGRVIGQELQNPAIILDMLKAATDSLYATGRIQIATSAETLGRLRAHASGSQAALEAMNRFEFISDPLLEVNELFIICDKGTYNLSPAAQVETLLTDVPMPLDLNPVAPAAAQESPVFHAPLFPEVPASAVSEFSQGSLVPSPSDETPSSSEEMPPQPGMGFTLADFTDADVEFDDDADTDLLS